MLIYKDTVNKSKSRYKCDRCEIPLERGKDEIYTIYVRRTRDRNPIKKWDLCEKDYRALCRGIEKINYIIY